MTLPASVKSLVGRVTPCAPATFRCRIGWQRTARSTCPYKLRQSKVRHLHAAAAVQQDVLRLDVAVDDALVVRELERIANLGHNGQRLARAYATAGEQLSQVHPVHEFHDEEIQSIRPAKIMDGDDARVVELGQRLGFAGEPFGKRGVVSNSGGQNLERHDSVEFFLPGFIHRPHAAAADQFDDFELGKLPRQFLECSAA